MSTKVEPATTATTAVASNPKISMFANKSGFVIPKNKLSGSLVPIFRGNKKVGGSSDATSEDNKQQVLRRTKWGPDLTQDPAVKKGRALAYQTRINQITQHLKLGSNLEIEDHQDSPLESSHPSDRESSLFKFNSEELGFLEVERREAIGEILKLNPTYKAPTDYKPLLKEAKVPIPIKEYPGYNFIGLIFGSASDTQKRLEKETGAKIRVYGVKEDTGEKNEITASDGNETLIIYKEVYVHICADTYEKVDAAVALIELLVTPVSVNPVSSSTTTSTVVSSGDSVNIIHPSQGTPTLYTPPPPPQPILGPPPPRHSQFNPYPNPPWWAPPPSEFTTNQNPSPPILTNPNNQLPSSSSSNVTSLFGPRPQNPSFQGQRPYMGPPNVSGTPPFRGNQPLTSGAPHNVRVPQAGPTLSFHNRPPLISAGWSHLPVGPTVTLGQTTNTGLNPVSTSPSLNLNSPFRPPPSYPSIPQPQMPTRGLHSSMSAMTSAPQPPRQLGNPNYVAETAPSFTAAKPPSVSAPVPLHPSSNNFTFQPHRPQNILMPRPTLPPPPQNFQAQQTPAPLFRPLMQGFLRPQISTTSIPHGPQRHPVFQNQGPVPSQLGPRSFGAAPFQARPGNPVTLLQQNYPVGSRPPNFGVGPNQQQQTFSVGKQQIYDPFSPTSVGQVGGGNSSKRGKQESDPEYEDLMASVGVK